MNYFSVALLKAFKLDFMETDRGSVPDLALLPDLGHFPIGRRHQGKGTRSAQPNPTPRLVPVILRWESSWAI